MMHLTQTPVKTNYENNADVAHMPQIVSAIHLVGLAFFVPGQGLLRWAMVSNKYFSTAVRIQMD